MVIGGKLFDRVAVTKGNLKIMNLDGVQLKLDFNVINEGFYYKIKINDTFIFPIL